MSGFVKGNLSGIFAAQNITFDDQPTPDVAHALDHITDEQALALQENRDYKAAQDAELDRHGAETVENAGRAANNIAQYIAGLKPSRKEEEEKKLNRSMVLMLALEASQQALGKALVALGELGIEIDMTILSLEQEKAEKLAQIEEIDAIGDNIRLIQNGGEPELDEDGTLKDKALERVIQNHEKKTGKPVDRENTSLLLAIMEQSLPDYPDKTLLNEHVNEIDQDLQTLHTMKGDTNVLIDEGHALEEEGERLEENGTLEEIEDYKERLEDYEERVDVMINKNNNKLDIMASREAASEASLKDNSTPENNTSVNPVATASFSMD